MAFFCATEGDQVVAEFRVNGEHRVTYKNVVIPTPLLSRPLRNRNLDPTAFSGLKLKIERARTPDGGTHAVLEHYLQSQPVEAEEKPRQPVVGRSACTSAPKSPVVASAIAGDVIHNLRSAP